MNPISTSSLFHFTKKYDVLKLILKNGLRYTYSCETFPIEIIKNHFAETSSSVPKKIYPNIAIPLISFCDTPLTRVAQHSNIYGKYFIGIEKDFINAIGSAYLNPLLYANADYLKNAVSELSALPCHLTRLLNSYVQKNHKEFEQFVAENTKNPGSECLLDLLPNDYRDLLRCKFVFMKRMNQILALYKPITGTFRGIKNYFFIDEREWRSFIPENDAEWKWGISKAEYFRNYLKWTNELIEDKKRYYTIIPQFLYCISHIAVDKEVERQNIIQYIRETPQLFGWDIYNQKECSLFKDILISKVTTFERIEADY